MGRLYRLPETNDSSTEPIAAPRRNSFGADDARSSRSQNDQRIGEASVNEKGKASYPASALQSSENDAARTIQRRADATRVEQTEKGQRAVLASRRSSSSSLSLPGAWAQGGISLGESVDSSLVITDEDDETVAQDNQPSLAIGDAVLVSDAPKDIDLIHEFLHSVDGGLGWEKCKEQCVDDATFTCQANSVAGMTTLKEYTEFTALVAQACPGATWTTHSTNWDRVAHTATVACTYHGSHTQSVPGAGPPVPTMKSANSDYCYIVKTDPSRENKIVHITKIWNDQWILQEWGWLPSATVADEILEDDHKVEGKANETKLKRRSTFSKLRRKISSMFR